MRLLDLGLHGYLKSSSSYFLEMWRDVRSNVGMRTAWQGVGPAGLVSHETMHAVLGGGTTNISPPAAMRNEAASRTAVR